MLFLYFEHSRVIPHTYYDSDGQMQLHVTLSGYMVTPRKASELAYDEILFASWIIDIGDFENPKWIKKSMNDANFPMPTKDEMLLLLLKSKPLNFG